MRSVAVFALCLWTSAAWAADIGVAAISSGKALLVIDGGKPRMVAVGEVTPEGVRLVSADSEAAVVEFDGRRQRLAAGHSTRLATAITPAAREEAVLSADSRGHFITMGAINGVAVRFVVDTGATAVAVSVDEARRLGINYLGGTRGMSHTANGTVPVYRVKLATVRVGGITLGNVDALVVDGRGLDIALLGMSFLNRTQMHRDGGVLTLTRRF